MSHQQPNAHWIVWFSLLCAGILSIVPLPEWMAICRPAWVPMVLIYWVLALPECFRLSFAFAVGLLLDVFQGSLFGVHPLSFVFLTAVALSIHQRIRLFPLYQQALVIFVLILGYQLIQLTVRILTDVNGPPLPYLLPALTSAAIWSWIVMILRYLRRFFQVT